MKRLLLILLLAPFFPACSPVEDNVYDEESSQVSAAYGESDAKEFVSCKYLPAVKAGGSVVSHYAYSLEYSEPDEQPRWVAYMLCSERLDGPYHRKTTEGATFHEDPDIQTGSATLEDYKGSGYSRGHLVPAGDMKWDSLAQVECFFFSNMSPMEQRFNSGIWNRMEQMMRRWAESYDTLYIVTGPLLTDGGSGKIGSDVTIPTAFYKAVYCPSLGRAIGFLVPHIQDKASLDVFAMSIDDLEQKTGIDFFKGLPDEDSLESALDLDKWGF